MEKIFEDDVVGDVHFVKKTGVKRVSIRVNPSKGVRVTLPYYVSYDEAMSFFFSKRDWVIATVEKLKKVQVVERSLEEVEQLKRQAAEYLPQRLRVLATRYGFTFSSLRLKHNKSNWGSCSSLKNINLNISLMAVPSLLRDYVILHELCHLRHQDHSRAFHLLLEHLCTDHVLRCMEAGDSFASEVARRAAKLASGASESGSYPAQLFKKILASGSGSGFGSGSGSGSGFGRGSVSGSGAKVDFPIERILASEIRRYRP